MDRIFVIMPVWILNEETWVLTCEAIQSLGKIDLCIIDNDSNPFYSEALLGLNSHIYLKNDTNLGYAKAVNQGLKLAPKGLVAIANNDIRVSPNWQEVVKAIFTMDPEIYSIHPRMCNYNEPFQFGNVIAPTGRERWCTGSFFVVNHDPEKPILYDENFLNSYDDWDYFMRVKDMGLKTCYTNMCAYLHHHSFTQQQVPQRDENNKRNAEYFKQKWGKYAEERFAELYPDQVAKPYWEGFN